MPFQYPYFQWLAMLFVGWVIGCFFGGADRLPYLRCIRAYWDLHAQYHSESMFLTRIATSAGLPCRLSSEAESTMETVSMCTFVGYLFQRIAPH